MWKKEIKKKLLLTGINLIERLIDVVQQNLRILEESLLNEQINWREFKKT